jgi:hypothetical protein
MRASPFHSTLRGVQSYQARRQQSGGGRPNDGSREAVRQVDRDHLEEGTDRAQKEQVVWVSKSEPDERGQEIRVRGAMHEEDAGGEDRHSVASNSLRGQERLRLVRKERKALCKGKAKEKSRRQEKRRRPTAGTLAERGLRYPRRFCDPVSRHSWATHAFPAEGYQLREQI